MANTTGTLFASATLTGSPLGAAQAAPAPGLHPEPWEDLARRSEEHAHQREAEHAQQIQQLQASWEAYSGQQLQQLQEAERRAEVYRLQVARLEPLLLAAERHRHEALMDVVRWSLCAMALGGALALVWPKGGPS